jgi:hypothetical protein
MRVEGIGFQAYILRVARWVSSGLNVLGFDGAPRVNLRIRSKPVVFRVFKPAYPWAKTRNQNPWTQNQRISIPNPIHCHL